MARYLLTKHVRGNSGQYLAPVPVESGEVTYLNKVFKHKQLNLYFVLIDHNSVIENGAFSFSFITIARSRPIWMLQRNCYFRGDNSACIYSTFSLMRQILDKTL